jgi:4-hydroxy-tetrahydrodipicolinate synthase
MKIQGTFTALVTPFDGNDHLDEVGLRANIRYQQQHGIDGIVLLGTTGETPTLSDKEQEKILSIGREEISGKSLFIAGTGNYSTSKTVEATRKAKELGADAALIVTPYYNRPTQEGMYRHFSTIADAVDIPIIVYSVQSRTGQNLTVDTLLRLAKIPNIVSVKEASGNILQIADVIGSVKGIRADFTVLSGDDNLALPVIAYGGDGLISVASNLFPAAVKQLVNACMSNRMEEARDLHYQLLPFFKAIFVETNPIPIKAAMNWSGLPAGECRLPLCPLLPESARFLRNILEKTLSLFPQEVYIDSQ